MARKILLADDSVTAQNMGRKILVDAGYEVVAVNNGSAALKKIGEVKPDLVVLDVYMPGYSGLEVCQRLKESHETARIPVLLTVGKLEPFKPEEAQRVRAEAFIVKPFEASELLSALSKLEDKVVPRAEPSRPGRFARAMAAVEESGRGRTEDNGWKNRISFPHEKTEAEEAAEKSDEQVSSYNPVNRDLRTVVETQEERAQEAAHQREESPKQESPGREVEKVDVAALAPTGVSVPALPKDVTQEELGAITAAAAQIQVATAAIEEEQRSGEAPIQTAGPAAETVGFEPPMREIDLDAAAPPIVEAPASESSAPTVDLQDSDLRRPDSHERASGELNGGQDVPVTIAATPDSVVGSGATSRWTAVAVALDGDEAGISLDHEMQKANGPSPASRAESMPASAAAEITATSLKSGVDSTVPEAVKEPVPAPETEPEVSAISEEMVSFSTARSEAPVTAALASPAAAPGIDSAGEGTAGPQQSETTAAAYEHTQISEPVAQPQVQHEGTAQEQPACDEDSYQPISMPEHATPVVEAAAAPAYSAEAPEAKAEPVAETAESGGYRAFQPADEKSEARPALDHETVKSRAAAWASWRQIRDTGKSAGEDRSQEFDAGPTREANAAAAAAGAEQSLSSTSPEEHENPSDVASIVDSVLADLRPKLMKEISRKIAEKK